VGEFSDIVNGAGIVVIRYFGDVPKILGLWDKDIYDLPKGQIEQGESPLRAALRETFEESGIYDLSFDVCGFETKDVQGRLGQCRFFAAVTSDDPQIVPNPQTGVKEHSHAKWLTVDEIEGAVKPWLKPAVFWARNKLKDGISNQQ
jgi:8-oxo-dGTP pyrophosphatase MutT (NUDIX family)